MKFQSNALTTLLSVLASALAFCGSLQAQGVKDATSLGNLREAAASEVAKRPAASATTVPETEYRIGPQDLMEVAVFGQPELARTVRVNSRGQISLPLIGQIDAVGLSSQQLERLIADRLSEKYLQDPQVTVFMKEFTTVRFTVEGAVNKPGVYPLRANDAATCLGCSRRPRCP